MASTKGQDWAIASRGDTYRQTQRYDQAPADLNRAVELDPSQDWVIARRGEVYKAMKRYEEALADVCDVELGSRLSGAASG